MRKGNSTLFGEKKENQMSKEKKTTVTGRKVLEGGEFFIHNDSLFGVVSILKTPTCEYVKAEIWQRNPTGTNNIKLVFDRCYGLSEIDRAIRIVRTYFQGQMGRMDTYHCPADRAAALGWSQQGCSCRQPMTLDDFVRQVRDELCILGLPLNGGWQPSRESIQVWFARGFNVKSVLRAYRRNIERHEAWVNGNQWAQEN